MRLSDLDTGAIRGKVIFLDVDGTLVADGQEHPSPGHRDVALALARDNEVYLASNGSYARTERLGNALGIPVLPRLAKPVPHGAARALARGKSAIVIGDKLLTDGCFAYLLGAEFIQLKPLRSNSESLLARVAYTLDSAVAAAFSYFVLMRPQQWIKNLLVFAPLFFADALFSPVAVEASIVAFVAFCVAASGVYVLNDLFDREQDRAHPTKRHRPLAAGRVSARGAYCLIAALALLEAFLLIFHPALTIVVVLYILLNGSYTAWLKHIAILDILCVASFYVLRIVGGGAATGIPLSPWILFCTFFAALFIVVGKRRAEFRHESRRKVLEEYSKETLDFMLAGTAALAIISYGLYSILGHDSSLLIYSTVFVVLAFFRVLNRIYTHPEQAEAPETLLYRDPVVLAAFLAWALYVFFVFYFAPILPR